MRIVFMGATELGWECCRTLLEIGQEVVGIFSIPQEFRISWSPASVNNVQFKSFADLAAGRDIPLIYVTKKMSDPEYEATLRQLRPDLLVVIGWYYMVPRALRALAPLGAVGIHASLLPKYRGGAPLVWTIINGESQTGVSLFHFADGVDDGDLIGQRAFDIRDEDTIASVIEKASRASVGLVREYIPLLASGQAPAIPQDHGSATFVPQRRPEDGLIDWHTMSAKQVYDWVRAQTRPYPGAFTFLGEEKIVIWRSSIDASLATCSHGPGTIITSTIDKNEGFGVCCADGRVVRAQELGLADGAVVSAAEYVARRSVGTGTLLGKVKR